MYPGAIFHQPLLEAVGRFYCRLFCSEFALEQEGNEPQLWSYCINAATALCFFLGSVWLNCGGLQGWIPCPPTSHGH